MNEEAKTNAAVPFFVHEADMARMERANQQLVEQNNQLHKTIRTLVISFFTVITIMIIGFLVYESQFETVAESTTLSGEVVQDSVTGHNTFSYTGGDSNGETSN